MTRIYFPGCKVRARYPEASTWLMEQVLERGYADEKTGCCYCTACDAGLEEGGKRAVNIIELVSSKFRER